MHNRVRLCAASDSRKVSFVASALAGAFLLLWGAGECAAQAPADDIAKGIEAYLALMEDQSQPLALHHDKVTVTSDADGKSFAVAITGLKFGDAEGGIDFGEVDYRLTPADAGTYQVGDLKLAKEMQVVGADGKPVATLTFETTQFSALWSAPLQNFLKLGLEAKNLTLKAADQPGNVVAIDSFAVNTDGKDAGKGLLTQTTHITLAGIAAKDPSDGTGFKLDKLTGTVAVENFDFPGYRAQMAKLETITAKLAAAGQQAPSVPTDGSSTQPDAAPTDQPPSDQSQPDQSQSDQSQSDQSQSDQSQSDQSQSDQSQSDQSQSDESQSDQSQLAGSRPAEAQPDANQSDAQASTDGDAGAAPATPAPALSDEDRKALAEIVRGLPKLLSAYSYDLGIEGVTVTDPNGGVLGRLAHGGTAFGVKGLDTDKAEASFSLKHDGLDIAGPEAQDPITKALLPRSGNLALVATDIPVPTLADAVAQALPDLTSGDAQGAQGAQYVLMGALMQALSNSTIKLRIDPSEIQTEQTHLTASGAFQLAMQSPEMAVGTADLALTGLDNIAALVAKLPADSPDAGMAKGILQSIRSVSKRATGADGKPVDKFKIELTDKGAATVNGKPLDQVVQ